MLGASAAWYKCQKLLGSICPFLLSFKPILRQLILPNGKFDLNLHLAFILTLRRNPTNLQRWLKVDPQTSSASFHSGSVLTGTEAAHVLVTAMVLHGSHLRDC